MNILLAEFKNIDQIVGGYYNKCHITNYFDNDGKGLFLKFIIDQELVDIPINDELGDHCIPTECLYTDFDLHSFPLNNYIDSSTTTNKDKGIIIFYILQFCYKYGSMPQPSYILQKVHSNQFNRNKRKVLYDKGDMKELQKDIDHDVPTDADEFSTDKKSELSEFEQLAIEMATQSTNNDISAQSQNNMDASSVTNDQTSNSFKKSILSLAKEMTNNNKTSATAAVTNCNGNIKDCEYFLKIKDIVNAYHQNMNSNNHQQINTVDVLNNFNHLIFKHNTDNDMEFIHSQLNKCDVTQCRILHRHYRNRIQNGMDDIDDYIDDNDNNIDTGLLDIDQVYCGFIDKIHCHFVHCYDIGYRSKATASDKNNNQINKPTLNKKKLDCLFSTKNKFNNQLYNQHTTASTESNPFTHYSFGESYYYWEYYKHYNAVDWLNGGYKYSERFVEPKFDSFKEEMLNNGIERLNQIQWNQLYQEAIDQRQTDHCKEHLKAYLHDGLTASHFGKTSNYGIKPNTAISINHLVSIIIYTSYDSLSYKFSKTFRRIGVHNIKRSPEKQKIFLFTLLSLILPSKTEKEDFFRLKAQHSNFHYLSKYINEAVNVFSPKNYDEFEDMIFYHGTSIQSMFNSTHCFMYQPFSTTTSLDIAQQFSGNNGMVYTLKISSSHVSAFDCAWLSHFGNESEYLFISTCGAVTINNITNISKKLEYSKFIQAITILGHLTYAGEFNQTVYDMVQQTYLKFLSIKIIKHELSLYKPTKYKRYSNIPPYIDLLLHNICVKKQWTIIDYNLFKSSQQYYFLKSYFCYKHCDMINLQTISTLFPNIKLIGLFNVPHLSQKSLNNIFSFAKDNKSDVDDSECFPVLVISIKENPTKKANELLNEYKTRFMTQGWYLSIQHINGMKEIIKQFNVSQWALGAHLKYMLVFAQQVNPDAVFNLLKNPQMLQMIGF